MDIISRHSTRPLITSALLLAAMAPLPCRATPAFNTHHSPVGAWSSMTFGLPGDGIGIETESLVHQSIGDLVVACSRGTGKTMALPFFTSLKVEDYEGGKAGNALPGDFKSWHVIPARELERTLTPGTDEFHGGDLRLRVISPRLPSGLSSAPDFSSPGAIPALLIELEVDNSAHDEPATGFLGIAKSLARPRALDWADASLAGIGYQDRWALAAKASDSVFTIRAGSVAPLIEAGTPMIHPGGSEGGIAFRIPPHTRQTLVAALGFYRPGNNVAQGIPTSYGYTTRYDSVESVCHAALDHAEEIRNGSREFDKALAPAGTASLPAELLAQASQAYYANSSLLHTTNNDLLWSINEGQFAWRNTLDLAVDHLPYELTAHPWVSRNVIDGFIDRYSYEDTVRYDHESKASHPGGLSFAHDQGNYTAYSPPGRGGYEQPDRVGLYSFMTTEQLLNGALCASACALRGGDKPWSARRLPVAGRILSSMENREGRDAAGRPSGILSAQSDRVGKGAEITTYDALDHSLQDSRGSLYIVVKTWASAIMLEEWFRSEGATGDADRAHALRERAVAALASGFQSGRHCFPANLLEGGDSLVIAALEPLSIPLFCGLGSEMKKDTALIGLLRDHARTCLAPGKCLDAATGGLRLSDSTPVTWPSKAALTMAVLSWLEPDPKGSLPPSLLTELGAWMQVSAAKATVSDQINAATRQQISGAYYPRLVSVMMLLSPPPASARSSTPSASYPSPTRTVTP